MNLVLGSLCPLHDRNDRCPCRTLTTNSSIWTAAELGDVDRVRIVVEVKRRNPDSLDPHGYTPLHLAAQNGRLSVVQYLLEAGARPDGVPTKAGGCGATPLHRAAFAGQLPCVRALLSAGASTSATDASFLDMKTPLHKAAAQGHKDVCIALMEAGADPNAGDAVGNSALDVLSLSAPSLPDAGVPSNRRNTSVSGSGCGDGGDGDNGMEICSSVVALSNGKDPDWGGVRKALERHGGCHKKVGKARRTDLSGSGDGEVVGGEYLAYSTSGAGIGGREAAASAKQEHKNTRGLSPLTRVPSREAGGAGANHTLATPRGTLEGQARGDCAQVDADAKRIREVDAVATPAPEPSRGHVVAVDNPRPGGGRGGGKGAGIPCGECLAPKMVMMRSSCCGTLLCKPCVKSNCARRQNCRRCRDTSDETPKARVYP